jgi:hypothetical protein
MASPLHDYIIGQEHAGVADEQIKQALLARGYTQTQVDAAFNELKVQGADPVLLEYVQQYARQGSTPVQIFNILTQQGYAPGKVRGAVRQVFGVGTLPTHHGMAFLAIALVIGAGLFFLLHDSSQEAVLQQPGQIGTEVTLAEQIEQVITVAKNQGIDAGIKECQVRLASSSRDLCILDVVLADGSQLSKCDQVSDVGLRDKCLMNFIDQDREKVCSLVKLKESTDTCEVLAALKGSAKA